jgi:Helix-turn-helix domain
MIEKYERVQDISVELTGIAPSCQTVGRMARQGRLNAKKILGKWMCKRSDFVAYIEASTAHALQPRAEAAQHRSRSSAALEKAQAAADAELDAAGI